jgi:hypothetical protein
VGNGYCFQDVVIFTSYSRLPVPNGLDIFLPYVLPINGPSADSLGELQRLSGHQTGSFERRETHEKWIGLRENLNRKFHDFPMIMGLSSNISP